MHDIERYGVGKNELAAWRDAKQATLLFASNGDSVMLTLVADEGLIGRHVVPTNMVAEVLAGYAHFWQSGAKPGANEVQRSFVTGWSIKGQGNDTPIVPHTPPKGFPPVNFVVHQQIRTYINIANEAERG